MRARSFVDLYLKQILMNAPAMRLTASLSRVSVLCRQAQPHVIVINYKDSLSLED